MGTQISAFAMTDPQSGTAKKITSQTFVSNDTMMLVATPILHKGGNATFTLVPRPVENVDGIQTPKSTPDLTMVAHTSPNGGKPVYTWIPRPVEGIDGIPIPKPTPNG